MASYYFVHPAGVTPLAERYVFAEIAKAPGVWKPNKSSREVIGLVSPYLVKVCNYPLNVIHPASSAEWAEYPDRVRLLLQNPDGARPSKLFGIAIRGFPVIRLSGEEGLVNDEYKNYERMAKEGENVLEYGNNYIVNKTQVNKIADWLWKYNLSKKHVYTVALAGFASYFEIGEWYTLVVSSTASTGAVEAINSVVECVAVECQQDAGDIGQTTVSFREVQTNWSYDSVEYARFVAVGRHGRRETGRQVTVGAATWTGYADFYCDGVDDQVEFNTAIAHLNGLGGGSLKQVGGPFYTSSAIIPCSNLLWEGDGAGAGGIIASGDYDVVSLAGSAGAYAENFTMRNMAFQKLDTNMGTDVIELAYINNVRLENIDIVGFPYAAITLGYCTGFVSGCDISGVATSANPVLGIVIGQDGYMQIDQNAIHGLKSSGGVYGIQASATGRNRIAYNSLNDIINYASNSLAIGIELQGNDMSCLGNNISSVVNAVSTASAAWGIYANLGYRNIISQNVITTCSRGILNSGTQMSFVENRCFNNGPASQIINVANGHFQDSGASTMTNVNSWQ